MLKGYKTIIVNGLVLLFAVLTAVNPETQAPTEEAISELVDKADAAILAVVAIVNVILRAVTTSPMFKKE